MKINSLLLGLLALFTFAATDLRAQTVSSEVAMTFGEMVVGGTGTVTIDSATDSRSATGSIALVGSSFISRGSLVITHTPGAQVVITVPPSIAMSGPNSPTLAPTVEGGTVQTIPPGGTLTVYFGGTVTFSVSGATGVASCIIPVQIDPV